MAIRNEGTMTMKAMRWIVDNKMESKKPVSCTTLFKQLKAATGNTMLVKSLNRAIKKKLRMAEDLEEFTLLEKVQMIFMMGVPVVSDTFKNTLTRAADTFTLDDHQRITLFRATVNGRLFVRKGNHKPWTGTHSTSRNSLVNDSASAHDEESFDEVIVDDPPNNREPETKPVFLVQDIKPEMPDPAVQFAVVPTFSADFMLSQLHSYATVLESRSLEAFQSEVSTERNRPGRKETLITQDEIYCGLRTGLTSVLKAAAPNLDASTHPRPLLEFLNALKLIFLTLGLSKSGSVVSLINQHAEPLMGTAEHPMVPMTRLQFALQSLFEAATPPIDQP